MRLLETTSSAKLLHLFRRRHVHWWSHASVVVCAGKGRLLLKLRHTRSRRCEPDLVLPQSYGLSLVNIELRHLIIVAKAALRSSHVITWLLETHYLALGVPDCLGWLTWRLVLLKLLKVARRRLRGWPSVLEVVVLNFGFHLICYHVLCWLDNL